MRILKNEIFKMKRIRIAQLSDLEFIWPIVSASIEKRRLEGSQQWQDGYPNPDSIANDIGKGYGYVLLSKEDNKTIIGYAALIYDIEPAYEELTTGWLTKDSPYAVIHRMATLQDLPEKGLGTLFMQLLAEKSKEDGLKSLRVDTNFDNTAMLRILEKLNYTYAGEVYFRGSARKAFEIIL